MRINTQSSKTKTTFFRRLYVAYLIDSGINTIPAIMNETAMPRRTIQDVIFSLAEIDLQCEFQGATKNGFYVIKDWASINREWIEKNLQYIVDVLEKVD